MQIEITFAQIAETKNAISFEQAEAMYQLKKLTDEYEKLRDTARYLYGKKRGAWGRMTQADEKRSAKLDNLRGTLQRTQTSYNLKYNQ